MTSATKSAVNPAAAAREIVITRMFDAPRELVWQAMTDPKHVVHWWGPRGFTTTIQQMDVRPGGIWQHVMRGRTAPTTRAGVYSRRLLNPNASSLRLAVARRAARMCDSMPHGPSKPWTMATRPV